MLRRRLWAAFLAMLLLWVAVLLFFGDTYWTGYFSLRYGKDAEFIEILRHIEYSYVDSVDINACREKIIKSGLHGCVDVYSGYYTLNELMNAVEKDNSFLSGIGVEIDQYGKDKYIRVTNVSASTVAERAGIKKGDLIIEIDGATTKGMSAEDAVKKIRGRAGDTVILIVQHRTHEFEKMTLVREKLTAYPIRFFLVTSEIMYIRLMSFGKETAQNLSSVLELFILSLVEGGIDTSGGVILDLRGNPGGYLEAAIESLYLFSPYTNRMIVRVKGAHQKEKFMTRKKGFFADIPLVVLIDGRSASASEIVAGVLKEWGVELVGQISFGKGSVQEFPIPLSSGGALKLTIAHYYLGEKETPVDGIGISPNYEVPWKKVPGQSDEDFIADFSMNFGDPEKDPQMKKAIEVLKKKMNKPWQ